MEENMNFIMKMYINCSLIISMEFLQKINLYYKYGKNMFLWNTYYVYSITNENLQKKKKINYLD